MWGKEQQREVRKKEGRSRGGGLERWEIAPLLWKPEWGRSGWGRRGRGRRQMSPFHVFLPMTSPAWIHCALSSQRNHPKILLLLSHCQQLSLAFWCPKALALHLKAPFSGSNLPSQTYLLFLPQAPPQRVLWLLRYSICDPWLNPGFFLSRCKQYDWEILRNLIYYYWVYLPYNFI